jgi:C4-dicarboxylate transporter DctM subunit
MALAKLKTETYTTFSSYSLSIIPMFLLMGQFATLSGMSTALFKAAESWLGHRRGGVAMAAVGACAGFGAICGSSLATAATMSRVALPELRRYGYSGGFSTATLAAGGTLGILIPPSVILVIYAILTEQNIAKLFLAAFVPGILAAHRLHDHDLDLCAPLPDAPARASASLFGAVRALVDVWPVLIVFGSRRRRHLRSAGSRRPKAPRSARGHRADRARLRQSQLEGLQGQHHRRPRCRRR